MRGRSWLAAVGRAIGPRPSLWPVALRQLRRLAEPGWWRSSPRLPLPSPEYRRFRSITAYGDPDAAPERADVVTYLRWCRQWEHVR